MFTMGKLAKFIPLDLRVDASQAGEGQLEISINDGEVSCQLLAVRC